MGETQEQTQLEDQPSARPTRKLVAGVTSGGVAVVLVWVASLLGVTLPPEVAGVLVLAAGSAASYLVRNVRTAVANMADQHGLHLDANGDGIADR